MAATLLARPRNVTAPPPPGEPSDMPDLDRIEAYPTLSATAVRAMALVNAVDIPLVELAGLVRRDTMMAAAVLGMANSCRFRGRSGVQDIQQAIVRVGLRECGKLICALGVRDFYNQFPPATRQACDTLHQHSLFVGCLAAEVDKGLGLGQTAQAFTAGLLHDIGRVVVCAKAPGRFPQADPLDFDEDGDLLRRERECLGTDHCDVGYKFARHNGLPDGVARVILNHHRPAAEHESPELVMLVAAADRIANHAQREHRIVGYDPRTCPAYRLLAGRLAPARDAAFRQSVPKLVVKAMRETRTMLRMTRT